MVVDTLAQPQLPALRIARLRREAEGLEAVTLVSRIGCRHKQRSTLSRRFARDVSGPVITSAGATETASTIALHKTIRAISDAAFSSTPTRAVTSLQISARNSRVVPCGEQDVGSVNSRKMLLSISAGE
jgi:hypothetical protein